MYADVQELIDDGKGGKWLQIPDEEKRVLIKSIAAINLVRGNKGQGLAAIRHYEREGLIAFAEGPVDVENHPSDLKQ